MLLLGAGTAGTACTALLVSREGVPVYRPLWMVAPIVSFGSGSGMRLTGYRCYWSHRQAPEKVGIPSFCAFFFFSA
uniref:Uncharacterized protein n=1 Tax=Ixodes ricinus TaxID=34613 RepID=A0A6B0TTV5_IXORI